MELKAGQVIERYEVEQVLGEGGMAVVYRVRHRSLDTLHALKILTIPTPVIRERLVQEGKVQASLKHPHVASVTDVLQVDGNPALLMEFVDGPSLDLWLKSHHPDLDLAEEIFSGILDAVTEAHALGIVHRDLKPGNVLMAPRRDGSGWTPKVTDFGLAKAMAMDGDPSRTRTGMPMGTPAYMSPEQVRDAKNVDHRTDVFALGCILYELTCGRRTFDGKDTLEVFNAVAQGRYQPPREINADLPVRILTAIVGCLAVDQDARIPSCTTLKSVLSGDEPWVVPERESAAATIDWSVDRADAAPSSQTTMDPPHSPSDLPTSHLTPSPHPGPVPRVDPTPETRSGSSHRLHPALLVGAGLLMGALVVWLASDTPSTPASEAPESTATVAPEPEPAAEEAGESPTRRPRRMTRTVNGEVERSVTRTSSSTRTNPEPGQDSEPEVDQEPLTDPGTVQAAAAPATTSTGSDPSPDPTSAPGSVQADSTAPGQTTSTNKNGKQLKGRLSNLIEQGENMAMSVDRAANNKTTFSVVGDAESVQLTSGFGSFSPGNIPVGHYVIRAVFPGSEAMVAGEVDVKRGANLVLHCSSSTQSCTRE